MEPCRDISIDIHKTAGDRQALILVIAFALAAFSIFCFVIFSEPMIGVADNNDFSRMLFGLSYKDRDHYYSVERYTYVVSEYAFRPFPHKYLLSPLINHTLSPIHFIYAARLLSKLSGYKFFQSGILALLSGGAYCAVFTLLYRLLMPKRLIFRILLGLLIIFIFFDGRWLMWFNSLYGEPYTILGLAAAVTSFLLCFRSKRFAGWGSLFLLFVCGALMIGSKLQAITLILVCVPLNGYVVLRLRGREETPATAKRAKTAALVLMTAVQALYCYGIYTYVTHGFDTNRETVYQSVMTGILADAPDPESVLDELGLDRAFAADIGKHAYYPSDQYVFGALKSEKMREEFYGKVSNAKIIRYYLTHPAALLRGMSYTATQALYPQAFAGVHTEGYPIERDHNRFILWTWLRDMLPKHIATVMFVFIAGISVSVYAYRKKLVPAPLCVAFWAVLLAGVLQYLMPYIFNGHCDTKKQILIFNYVFDAACAVIIWFAVYAGVTLFIRLRGKKR